MDRREEREFDRLRSWIRSYDKRRQHKGRDTFRLHLPPVGIFATISELPIECIPLAEEYRRMTAGLPDKLFKAIMVAFAELREIEPVRTMAVEAGTTKRMLRALNVRRKLMTGTFDTTITGIDLSQQQSIAVLQIINRKHFQAMDPVHNGPTYLLDEPTGPKKWPPKKLKRWEKLKQKRRMREARESVSEFVRSGLGLTIDQWQRDMIEAMTQSPRPIWIRKS